ncbi:hypothetical protein [Neorhizobium galegae]|uniref:hypothetical protein n=1 Tax=Neorhizobium galegae TaxID=399 RepID=UPI002104EECB|nr:hypothetical protein [Neorhizobium galegae]MCQ1854885.1 hypothetical protein [Neorhizobium galegae]
MARSTHRSPLYPDEAQARIDDGLRNVRSGPDGMEDDGADIAGGLCKQCLVVPDGNARKNVLRVVRAQRALWIGLSKQPEGHPSQNETNP